MTLFRHKIEVYLQTLFREQCSTLMSSGATLGGVRMQVALNLSSFKTKEKVRFNSLYYRLMQVTYNLQATGRMAGEGSKGEAAVLFLQQ